MRKTTISERLKQIMREKGLRQTDVLSLCEPFCKKYGVRLNKNDLSQYVNGKTIPRQDKLVVLASALNVSETWLMGFEVNKEREELTLPKVDTVKKQDDTLKLAVIKTIINNDLTSEQLDELNRFIDFILSK